LLRRSQGRLFVLLSGIRLVPTTIGNRRSISVMYTVKHALPISGGLVRRKNDNGAPRHGKRFF
jgi:hypothetical protein